MATTTVRIEPRPEAWTESEWDKRLQLPPVVMLGGEVNALSVCRRLSSQGITVFAIGRSNSPTRHSRFAEWVDVPGDATPQSWASFLLSSQSDSFRGAVLLAGCDDAIEVLAEHRDLLEQKYLLDDANPKAQLCMLDKLATFRAAQSANVPTPRFWTPHSMDDVHAIRDELVFPLILKPLMSHHFQQHFRKKYFLAHDFAELESRYRQVDEVGLAVKLVEKVPSPDHRLCSYYTYLDEVGEPLFDFTKRVVRRHPPNMGMGAYHIVDDVPDIRELALRLFRKVGVRGMANAEFILDERDGQLKLIECNLRFTATNELIAKSGLDLAAFAYARASRRPLPATDRVFNGLRLWYPIEDFRSFLELRRRGELTFGQWLRSVMHRQTFPLFQWNDPRPSIMRQFRMLARLIKKP